MSSTKFISNLYSVLDIPYFYCASSYIFFNTLLLKEAMIFFIFFIFINKFIRRVSKDGLF